MIAWVRNLVIIFFILSIVYVVLSLRARLKQRDKLKADFLESDKTIKQSEFVAKGLQDYNKSYRPKLIVSVYLVPLFITAILIYLAHNT